MAETAACGFSQSAARIQGVGLAGFFRYYLSRKHRDAHANGCTMAALCSDAARQPEAVKASFEVGIENLLAHLQQWGPSAGGAAGNEARARIIDGVARAVGAIVLSRACPDDSPLADEILAVCRRELHEVPPTPAAG